MTFTELFEKMGLNEAGIGEMAYVLDAPAAMFDVVKDDMAKALLDDFSTKELLKQITENDDISIPEMKKEMVEMYDTVAEAFEEELNDLPKDRAEFFLELLAALRDKCLELPERKMVEIVYEKLDKDVILPTYAHNSDAGADVYANEDVEIGGNSTVLVKTGLRVAVPLGWELQVRPRSGMSLKTPIRIANAPGTIDSKKRRSTQWAA